jgi:hypothetical protein
VHVEALAAARVEARAGGRWGRCPVRGAAREPGEVKPAVRLLGHSGVVVWRFSGSHGMLRHSGVAVWRVGGGHGKQSEARGRAEAGRAEMGVGSEEVGIRFGAQARGG